MMTVGGGIRAKVAVTFLAVSMVTVHVPEPVQAPDQPEKVEPGAEVAVRATVLNVANCFEQVVPHEIPSGELRTSPVPRPPLVTARAKLVGLKNTVPSWPLLTPLVPPVAIMLAIGKLLVS